MYNMPIVPDCGVKSDGSWSHKDSDGELESSQDTRWRHYEPADRMFALIRTLLPPLLVVEKAHELLDWLRALGDASSGCLVVDPSKASYKGA
jgi:hypothetical protein